MSYTKTIRELALEALKTLFEGMKEGLPVADPYSITFDEVVRDKLPEAMNRRSAVLGIYDVQEREAPALQANGVTTCALDLVFEFRLVLEPNDNPSTELNRVLGDIKRKLREDYTLGGTVRNIEATGSEFQIDDDYDQQVSGFLYATMNYRHALNDPRRRV
jgi:hypothetical protein